MDPFRRHVISVLYVYVVQFNERNVYCDCGVSYSDMQDSFLHGEKSKINDVDDDDYSIVQLTSSQSHRYQSLWT